jgi:hypothetical protein
MQKTNGVDNWRFRVLGVLQLLVAVGLVVASAADGRASSMLIFCVIAVCNVVVGTRLIVRFWSA